MLNRSVALVSIALGVLSASAPAQVLFLDFGRTDRQSDPMRFNNFVPGVSLINNAIDETGALTGMGIEIVDPFFDSGEPSSLGTETPMGAAAQFGADATDDYYFGHTTPFAGADANPLGIVEFRDLNPGYLYTFTIFAARTGVSDTRDARYTLEGGNNATGVLNASNNESNVLVLADLVANVDGKISLSVQPGPGNDNTNGFFYLGAIRIDVVVPAPGTGVVLAGACVLDQPARAQAHPPLGPRGRRPTPGAEELLLAVPPPHLPAPPLAADDPRPPPVRVTNRPDQVIQNRLRWMVRELAHAPSDTSSGVDSFHAAPHSGQTVQPSSSGSWPAKSYQHCEQFVPWLIRLAACS
eukprot:g5919.t1